MLDIEKKMENEALRRIKELQERFDLDNKMQEFFERGDIQVLDFTDEDDDNKIHLYSEIVKDFYNEYNVRMYYVFIETMHICGENHNVLHVLYVSEHEDEWENSFLDEDNELLAYTYNITLNYPEFGYITLAKKGDYLGRIR